MFNVIKTKAFLFFIFCLSLTLGQTQTLFKLEQAKVLDSIQANELLEIPYWLINDSTKAHLLEEQAPLVVSKIFLAQHPQKVLFNNNEALLQYIDGTVVKTKFQPDIQFQNLFRFPNRILQFWFKDRILIADSSKSRIQWINIDDGTIDYQNDLSTPIENIKNYHNQHILIDNKEAVYAFNEKGFEWYIPKELYPGCGWEFGKESVYLINCLDGNLRELDLWLGKPKVLFGWPEKINQLIPYGSGFFIYAKDKLFYLNHNGNQTGQMEIGNRGHLENLMGQLVFKDLNRIRVLHQDAQKLDWALPELSFIEYDNSSLAYNDEGYLRMLDANFNSLWDYHGGSSLVHSPHFFDSLIVIIDDLPSITLLNSHSNLSFLKVEPMIKFLYQCLESSNALSDECINKKDSLAYIEPGHVILNLLDLKQAVESKHKEQIPKSLISILQRKKMRPWPIDFALSILQSEYQIDWIKYSPDFDRSYVDLISPYSNEFYLLNQKKLNIQTLDPQTGKVLNNYNYPRQWKYLGSVGQAIWFINNQQLIEWKPNERKMQQRVFNINLEISEIVQFAKETFLIGNFGEVAQIRKNKIQLITKPLTRPPMQTYINEMGILHQVDYREILWFPFNKKREAPNSKIKIWKSRIKKVYAVDSLFLVESEKTISLYNPSQSSTLWEIPFSDQIFSLVDLGNNRILLGMRNQQLKCLSTTDGKVLWEFQGENSLLVHPIYDNGTLYIDQGKKLLLIDALTGKTIGQKDFPIEISQPMLNESKLLIPTRNGLVMALPKSLFGARLVPQKPNH